MQLYLKELRELSLALRAQKQTFQKEMRPSLPLQKKPLIRTPESL